MTVRFTPQARKHLSRIAQYIRQLNPSAAHKVRQRIRQTAATLDQFPHIGHEGADPVTREVVVPQSPYIIVHTVDAGGDVYVIGIYHGAQLRPGQGDLDDHPEDE